MSAAPIITRAKRKQRALIAEELEKQLNKLREEEVRCNTMRQRVHERMATLQQEQAPVVEPEVVAPPTHRPIRHRPQPIIVDKDLYSDEEEGEYVGCSSSIGHNKEASAPTPLSVEFEELQ